MFSMKICSLSYRVVVVIKALRLCCTVRDLWIGEKLLPQDGSGKVPTTALCRSVDQFNTARCSVGSRLPAKSLELRHTIRLIREPDAEIKEIETVVQAIMDALHSPITTIPASLRTAIPSWRNEAPVSSFCPLQCCQIRLPLGRWLCCLPGQGAGASYRCPCSYSLFIPGSPPPAYPPGLPAPPAGPPLRRTSR